MSGLRIGFILSSSQISVAITIMIITTLSCTPPLVQLAGTAALGSNKSERQAVMELFREKVTLLTNGLNKLKGFKLLPPKATFYVYPNVKEICN